VKIYYQDNEIALFPPLEGDSAETFFLHDEDVAYENIGELFKALRLVLQGNVADNEVLVIDVDVLGIQMTEVCLFPFFQSINELTSSPGLFPRIPGYFAPDRGPLPSTLSQRWHHRC
jgi:hypothetical protein